MLDYQSTVEYMKDGLERVSSPIRKAASSIADVVDKVPRIARNTALGGAAVLAAYAAQSLIQPSYAEAQVVCSERGKFLERLANRYHEAPVAMGLASNGSIVEVIASESGETWTIIVTPPKGKSCVVASGTFWERMEYVAPDEGA